MSGVSSNNDDVGRGLAPAVNAICIIDAYWHVSAQNRHLNSVRLAAGASPRPTIRLIPTRKLNNPLPAMKVAVKWNIIR